MRTYRRTRNVSECLYSLYAWLNLAAMDNEVYKLRQAGSVVLPSDEYGQVTAN